MIKYIFILLMLVQPALSLHAQNTSPKDTAAKTQSISEDAGELARAVEKHKKAAEHYANESKQIKKERSNLRLEKLIAGVITIVVVLLVAVIFKKKRRYGRPD